ncbi:MAG: hypothetical protein WC455_29945 [Dehalococcoidia bacterium]|jgi:hypothetical protein
MKNCTGCKWAQWAVTKSGKLHPSGDGKCLFMVALPQLPSCMYWIQGPKAHGGYINRHMELERDCPYYYLAE